MTELQQAGWDSRSTVASAPPREPGNLITRNPSPSPHGPELVKVPVSTEGRQATTASRRGESRATAERQGGNTVSPSSGGIYNRGVGGSAEQLGRG